MQLTYYPRLTFRLCDFIPPDPVLQDGVGIPDVGAHAALHTGTCSIDEGVSVVYVPEPRIGARDPLRPPAGKDEVGNFVQCITG